MIHEIDFDICVPTYNSLDYLDNLVNGIQQNSSGRHKIILHDNGSTDNTSEWLKHKDFEYTLSSTNEGFCGVNHALRKSTSKYVMIFNADMYPMIFWDTEILKQIKKFESKNISKFTISSCLIEPVGCNPEYVIANYGTDIKLFNAFGLQNDFKQNRSKYSVKDTIQYSHPILLPRKLLEEIDYFDPQYFPGWASDHDLAMKCYQAGCRDFVMLGNSRVYHFVSKTFSQLPTEIRNRHGQDIFLKKWGMTVDEFRKLINVRGIYNHQH